MILHISTFQAEGGAAVAASRLNRALRNHGVDSRLLVYRVVKPEVGVTAWADTSWKEKMFWLRFGAERLRFLPYEKDKSVRFAFSPAAVGVPLERHPLVQQASVINLHWINFGFVSLGGLEKLFRLGKPVVWTMHDMWAFTGGCHYSRGCERYRSHCGFCPYLKNPGEHDLSSQIFNRKKNLLAAAPLTFVSPSRWLSGLIRHAALTDHLPVLTIPNPIDTSVFLPVDKGAVRRKLSLPVNKKLVLFAGANTQDPRKGYAYFRDALNALAATAGEIEILLFGKSQPDAYHDLQLPIHDLGKLTDTTQIAEAYAAADLMVVSSIEDNLPNTVMEAMACGTPVVGFDNGGIPDMIDHLKNGYVAEYRSAESLAEGIRWILENDADENISHSARQKVLETYAEGIVARQYEDLYQSLT
ncbi:glycosyltransferase family 4 protein [Persicitalea jodogahamensis]|uniref:Glycosyl transferase n=1 Tax=Persicitalea jodogahamensis TaxID=402147 RepID=A0A8J3D6F1_9BACT|nr:glycosyltransferase family 4 protein [Persicitalea jodogahamensis]GHB56797.1 glycosyl transferase [Persicitalea jodogahamensis]